MDEIYFNSVKDPTHTIKYLLSSIESIAWLHNCSKVMTNVEIMGNQILRDCDYWLVNRNNCIFYCKCKINGLQKLPEAASKIIRESNEESM